MEVTKGLHQIMEQIRKEEGILLLSASESWRGGGSRAGIYLVEIKEGRISLLLIEGEDCNVSHISCNVAKALFGGYSESFYSGGAYPTYDSDESITPLRGERLTKVLQGATGLLAKHKVDSVGELASQQFFDVKEVDEEGRQNWDCLSSSAVRHYYGDKTLAALLSGESVERERERLSPMSPPFPPYQ